MDVKSYELTFKTTGRTDIVEITDKVQAIITENGISQGLAVIFVPGSTAAVTTIEYETGVISDLARAIEKLAPEDAHYLHDRRWGDGNGYAHVRSALLGPSLSVPVITGYLALGHWQQIVLLDFDNRPRERRVLIQVMGEGAD